MCTQEGLLKSEQTILFKSNFQCKATIYHAPERGRKIAIMLPLLYKANAWLQFDEVIWLLNLILEKKNIEELLNTVDREGNERQN